MIMESMREDPSLLDAAHLMLCEWAADELRGAESSDEEGVEALDEDADTICIEGGSVKSQQLYAWLRMKLPPHLRMGLYREAQRLELIVS